MTRGVRQKMFALRSISKRYSKHVDLLIHHRIVSRITITFCHLFVLKGSLLLVYR